MTKIASRGSCLKYAWKNLKVLCFKTAIWRINLNVGNVWSGDNISIQNLSEATLPFLPRKSCQASTSASKIQLPDFLAILQDKKNKLSPMYLQRLLPQACSTSSHYHLRGHNFPVPTVRSSCALKAFLPRSIILWNDLPPNIQALRTVASFKAALKKHLKL